MTIKALIADDSRVDREILTGLLESVGIHDLVMAKDGEEAIRLFGQGTFGLIVTDWNMPERTGLDVVRAIRAKGFRMPILMVTGESGESKRAAAADAGASGFLTKPINPIAFINALTKHLDGPMTIVVAPQFAKRTLGR